jgi:thiamine-phosphate pyrophosphorylase
VRFKPPKIYPITDVRLSGLSHAEQVLRLSNGGATLIQLREKLSTSNEFYRNAQAALSATRNSNVRLIINDRVDIALALKAHGVHLGQSDIPIETARRLLGENAIIGLSTHDLEQVKVARRLPVDYVAFGPVFKTATKGTPDPVVGLEALQQAHAILKHIPLVAIGGITIENAPAVFAAGADAVAIIGALLADPAQIEQNTRRFLNSA